MRDLPNIVLIGTGGTIASSAGSATELHGYKVTASIDEVLNAAPNVHELAKIHCEQVVNVESHEIDSLILLQIAKRVDELLKSPDVDGVVITHGTDTLEETAYFLNLTLKSTKPVVMVGAMRPATALSADGPLNLYNAFRLVTDQNSSGKGVLVMLNDRIGSARNMTKASTTGVDAFRSVGQGYLGEIVGNVVHFYNGPMHAHTLESVFTLDAIESLPQVDIIYDHQGAGKHLYHAAIAAGAQGIILAATGNGSLSPSARAGAEEAIRNGVLFVRSSRVGEGIVTGSADDEVLGLVAANSLNPQKARILLMLALGITREFRIVQGYFDRY
ncbi:L-asparaginase 2 precursor [compost metagenome]